MAKISKKYIGGDQVGSVQIELENALSLRAKSQDGLSSVDLLEFSSDDQMVIQQTMYLSSQKDLISLNAIENTFNIKTDNSSPIMVMSNDLASGNTGEVSLESGNATSGNSGNISLVTGTASGVRGIISLNADYVSLNSSKIKNLADPEDAQDAATMAFVESYVDSQISTSTEIVKEIITLDSVDIINQYVDLTFECHPNSVQIGVGQRVNLYQSYDFNVLNDGGAAGVARVSFIGPSASGGAEALVDGDILYINFIKAF